ncbi:hypothetical protein BB561_000777 [Smittium simulii]|uniref:Uncharacterized protein n=1 Tax=Smittium simulii TaxID=133385 RepID=A0A2T9YXK4_9FUNG|nr:hypothetical protein BB561_000777 [Smittium simulii]
MKLYIVAVFIYIISIYNVQGDNNTIKQVDYQLLKKAEVPNQQLPKYRPKIINSISFKNYKFIKRSESDSNVGRISPENENKPNNEKIKPNSGNSENTNGPINDSNTKENQQDTQNQDIDKKEYINNTPDQAPSQNNTPDQAPSQNNTPDQAPSQNNTPDQEPSRNNAPDQESSQNNAPDQEPSQNNAPDQEPTKINDSDNSGDKKSQNKSEDHNQIVNNESSLSKSNETLENSSNDNGLSAPDKPKKTTLQDDINDDIIPIKTTTNVNSFVKDASKTSGTKPDADISTSIESRDPQIISVAQIRPTINPIPIDSDIIDLFPFEVVANIC